MNDGSELSGQGRIRSNKIVFFSKSGEKTIYDYNTVSHIYLINKKGEESLYEYKKIIKPREKKRIKLMEGIIIGDLCLYQYKKISGPREGNLTVAGGGKNMVSGGSTTYTCIGFNGELEVVDVTMRTTRSKKFIEQMAEYLSYCPELLEKIQQRYFRLQDFEGVVDYYNEHCGEE